MLELPGTFQAIFPTSCKFLKGALTRMLAQFISFSILFYSIVHNCLPKDCNLCCLIEGGLE